MTTPKFTPGAAPAIRAYLHTRTKRGGCKSEYGDAAELLNKMKLLRRDARLVADDGGEIGRVWKQGGQWTWYFDPAKLARAEVVS